MREEGGREGEREGVSEGGREGGREGERKCSEQNACVHMDNQELTKFLHFSE